VIIHLPPVQHLDHLYPATRAPVIEGRLASPGRRILESELFLVTAFIADSPPIRFG
jgi:hypothetical protein